MEALSLIHERRAYPLATQRHALPGLAPVAFATAIISAVLLLLILTLYARTVASVEVATALGTSDAFADIRRGRIVLQGVCSTPTLVGAWATLGVECPLLPFGRSCLVSDTESVSAHARRTAYDAAMVRHIRARYGPYIFHTVRQQAKGTAAPAP